MTTTSSDVIPVVSPADHVPGPPQGQWTYDDYAALPDDGQRYEMICGVLYMAATPSFLHQRTVLRFGGRLRELIDRPGLGLVAIAPFDVRLPFGDTVQPDVLAVLQAYRGIIQVNYALGTPDLVVEVASPSTRGYDRRQKQDAYARARVPEYWIVEPSDQAVEMLVLEGNDYRSLGVFQAKAILPTQLIPNLTLPVEGFFAWPGLRRSQAMG